MVKFHKQMLDEITNDIIKELEKGVIPWEIPWNVSANKNFLTKKPYRGMNILTLGMSSMSHGFGCSEWLTYKQAKSIGANIKNGEFSKSTPIVFFQPVSSNKEAGDNTRKKTIFIYKFYRAFNLEQTEQYEELKEKCDQKFNKLTEDGFNVGKNQEVLDAMKNPPRIIRGGVRACYIPKTDEVHLPPTEVFKSVNGYWKTLWHEIGHSTAHHSRLARKTSIDEWTSMGDPQYSKEELIAELIASFMCGITGTTMESDDNRNSASYISHWIKSLQGDNRMVVSAATQAHKAVEYILNIKHEYSKEEKCIQTKEQLIGSQLHSPQTV